MFLIFLQLVGQVAAETRSRNSLVVAISVVRPHQKHMEVAVTMRNGRLYIPFI